MCGPEIHALMFNHNGVRKYYMNSSVRNHEGLRMMMAQLSREYREAGGTSPFPDDAYAYTTEVSVNIDEMFDEMFFEDRDLADWILLLMHGIFVMGEDINFSTLVQLALKRQEVTGEAEPLGDVLDLARDCAGEHDIYSFVKYFFGEPGVKWLDKHSELVGTRDDEIFDYNMDV